MAEEEPRFDAEFQNMLDSSLALTRWAIEGLRPEQAETLKRWAVAFTEAKVKFGDLDAEGLHALALEQVPEADEVWGAIADGIKRQAELRDKRSRRV